MASQPLSPTEKPLESSFISGRFWVESSLLDRTRLDRFILISFVLHLMFIVVQALLPAKTSSLSTPPPIQVEYVDLNKPETDLQRGSIVDVPKPEKIEPPKNRELLSSFDSRAHSNKKKTVEKEYRRRKTVVPKSSGNPRYDKKALTPAKKRFKQKTPKAEAVEAKVPLPLSDRGTQPRVAPPETPAQEPANPNSGNLGSMSLLDGFDPEKYVSQNTGSELEDADDDEAISLDTQETKYASYFARIKHQIERVWIYPIHAAQRGISGELTLRFRISRDGSLLGVQLINQSGHEILDMAAVKAVKEAAPFYPFPLTIQKEKLSILAT
ncbi:MAG: TonB family protein, partial [Nitrospinaceae bacterium]|nr:TonB family protein [Nitrospinaceae bacterium]NIR57990.1 TonB family protein [Nitrospinaceae bacterium]NIS88452.1 TonB family protein [Nitrospinaceae bacterium]NIT85332.1 TonB family protein [Nitrospinaceae bacterium]NIU47483.1 TonB family protein [Nitrospinaceae bacterium]